MNTPKPPTLSREAFESGLRNSLAMAVFTIVFTAAMALTYEATHEDIEQSLIKERMRLVNTVLPPALYDNNLLEDFAILPPHPKLGLPKGGKIYRARKNGQAAGLVLETAANDGYSGRIELLVALDAQMSVIGVRVTEHKETPGLGDYIVPEKDKNKAQPWINQFSHHSLENTPTAQWTVKKDGGAFDYRTGATISARAVSQAVGRAVQFSTTHQAEIFNAEKGEQLKLENTP